MRPSGGRTEEFQFDYMMSEQSSVSYSFAPLYNSIFCPALLKTQHLSAVTRTLYLRSCDNLLFIKHYGNDWLGTML